MRRTGNDFDSPATGIAACGGSGMAKDVAFMKVSAEVAEAKVRTRIYAVAPVGARAFSSEDVSEHAVIRLESPSCSSSLFEHDLFGKPVSTFPDHALRSRR